MRKKAKILFPLFALSALFCIGGLASCESTQQRPEGTYTITASDVTGGDIIVYVNEEEGYTANVGDNIRVTFKTELGYTYVEDSYTVNGVLGESFTFTMPEENVTLNAAFEKKVYTITGADYEYGSITPSVTSASYGDVFTVSVTFKKSACALERRTLRMNNSLLDRSTRYEDTEYTVTMPNTDVELSGSFVSLITMAGEGTQASPWLIETKEDFMEFVSVVNDYHCVGEDSHFKLVNDISLGEEKFGGIGSASGDEKKTEEAVKNAFKGVFDGNGKTITADVVGTTFTGLFNVNAGTIKNLTVAGSVSGTTKNVGGIVGYNVGGTVENCVNKATLSKTVTSVPYHYGGVVGFAYGGTIKNCTNLANLTVEAHTVGGIVGYAGYGATVENCVNGVQTDKTQATVSGTYEVAGIAGYVGTSATVEQNKVGTLVKDCVNYANVSSSGHNVGGVASVILSDNTIDGCKNYGNVSGVGTDNGGVGGIVGRHCNAVVKNCVNGYSASELSADTSLTNGTVQNGGLATGGITGRMMTTAGGQIVACINYMNVTGANNQVGGVLGSMWVGASVDGCKNYGMIECEGNYAGGILGYCNTKAPTVKNNDNYGNVSAKTGVGGVVGLYNVAGTYTIENCHNHATITGTSQYGGVVGRVGNYAINLTVTNCSSGGSYAQADVIGSAGAKANITITGGNA